MEFINFFFIGVGLSMDAFAVSLSKGLAMRKINYRHRFVIALAFGFFQGLMPFLGWSIGIRFEKYITRIDHWIAFVLLSFIGGKMIYEALTEKDEEGAEKDDTLDYKELFIMAVATSIDALAVGISFAFLNIKIIPAITIIAVTTFIISFAGVLIGNHFGTRYKEKAEIFGGGILIFIGLRILLEHLGVFS